MKKLSTKQRDELLKTLESRFESNPGRHKRIRWVDVCDRLKAVPAKLAAVSEMERSGGEPDVIGYDKKSDEYLIVDCSKQSPTGRRSLCYDDEALQARKKHKPDGSAVEAAAAMGVALLDEADYRALQALGEFDTTTSSWLLTPPAIRERGGAIFGDYRYGTVFVYHNGAESYYAARGFRCKLFV